MGVPVVLKNRNLWINSGKAEELVDNMNYKNYKFQNVSSEWEEKDAYKLWEQCFGDTKAYMDFYFRRKREDNKIIALYEEQETNYNIMIQERITENKIIASMIHLNPYMLKVYNTTIMAHYIVGVATRPENRKQGLMRYLMKIALKEMYQAGELFTYLMPAKEEIYLPFDFRHIYEQNRYSKALDGLSGAGEIGDGNLLARSWSEAEEAEKQKAVSFAIEILSGSKDIYVLRNRKYYETICEEMQAAGGDVLLVYREKGVIGIVCYMKENTKTEITESILYPEYTEEVVRYFEALTGGREMEITYYDSSFMKKDALTNRDYKEKTIPVIMARLVNLEQFFKQMETTSPMFVTLQVTDDILLENNKTFTLDFNGEGKKLVDITEKEPEFTIDIGTLTRFLLGNGEILQQCHAVEELKKIRRNSSIYINEIT